MIDPSTMFAGLGALAAGIGLFRFGVSRGALQNKAVQAFDLFLSSGDRIAVAQERQAAALEANARLIPLLESLAAQREQMIEKQEQNGLTLRVISREVRELKELMSLNNERRTEQDSADPSADGPAPARGEFINRAYENQS
jgi:hypothetical protein